ncbi:MAG: hypothetical protein ACR2NA_04705 [Solirubrobacterales bacterium]
MSVQIGVLSALLCAFFTNLAFLYKHRGACEAPTVEIRTPLVSARALFRSKWFAIGMGVALLAWLFHVAAMALAPLSLVQAVIAGGLVWLAVLADRMFGFDVGRRQWLGVALVALGLALLAITVPHSSNPSSAYSLAAMIAFEGGLVLIGAALVLMHRIEQLQPHHGNALAVSSGLLFGVSDIAIKAMTGYGLGFAATPWFPLAIAASIGAFFASARALQKGEAVSVITLTAAAANTSTVAGGIIVFGDPIAGDVLGLLVQFGAFALVIFAAMLTPAPIRAAEAR